MKQIIICLLITILIFVGIAIGQTLEVHYNRDVVVTNIQDQEVTIVDIQGHRWIFYGEDYTVGQRLTVTMYTNHTEVIDDDMIVEVKA